MHNSDLISQDQISNILFKHINIQLYCAIETQDTMNQFFTGKGLSDRGTFFNMKAVFRHHNLKSKVMDNFDHVWDFIEVLKNVIGLITESRNLNCLTM